MTTPWFLALGAAFKLLDRIWYEIPARITPDDRVPQQEVDDVFEAIDRLLAKLPTGPQVSNLREQVRLLRIGAGAVMQQRLDDARRVAEPTDGGDQA